MLRIYCLVSDNKEDTINGVARVMSCIRGAVGCHFEVQHVLHYTALVNSELLVIFGPGAQSHVLGQGALKLRRRSLHTTAHGHHAMVTFSADAALDSNQWLKIIVEDVLWGIRELDVERVLPDLTLESPDKRVTGFDVETVGEVADIFLGSATHILPKKKMK